MPQRALDDIPGCPMVAVAAIRLAIRFAGGICRICLAPSLADAAEAILVAGGFRVLEVQLELVVCVLRFICGLHAADVPAIRKLLARHARAKRSTYSAVVRVFVAAAQCAKQRAKERWRECESGCGCSTIPAGREA